MVILTVYGMQAGVGFANGVNAAANEHYVAVAIAINAQAPEFAVGLVPDNGLAIGKLVYIRLYACFACALYFPEVAHIVISLTGRK
jgi:hypothetical protein